MNVTLDGFMAGPNCELDWHFQSWTNEMADALYEQLSKADTILLGRVTYKAMAKYWPSKTQDMALAREDIPFAHLMNNYTKMVFSKTITRSEWHNSKFLRGDPAEEVSRLKAEPGRDMIVYGSGEVVKSLTNSGLVDEFQLWIHPVVLGHGKPLFKSLNKMLNLKLTQTKSFTSGVIVLYYQYQPTKKCLATNSTN
jgi:dihydrofolate reductase